MAPRLAPPPDFTPDPPPGVARVVPSVGPPAGSAPPGGLYGARPTHPSASAAAVGVVAEAHLVGGAVGGAVLGGGAHAARMVAPPHPAPHAGVPPPAVTGGAAGAAAVAAVAEAAVVAAAGAGGQLTREPPAPVAGDSHTSSPKSSRCSSVTEDAEIAETETQDETRQYETRQYEPREGDPILAEDEQWPPRADAPPAARADETSAGQDLGSDLAGPDAASSAAQIAPACQAAAPASGGASLQGLRDGTMPDKGEFEVC